jgi:hypothetical protein
MGVLYLRGRRTSLFEIPTTMPLCNHRPAGGVDRDAGAVPPHGRKAPRDLQDAGRTRGV